MSYNISALRVRSIDLKFPLDFDFQAWLQSQPDNTPQGFENVGKRWFLEDKSHVAINFAAQTWELELGNQSLNGVIANNQLVTTEIDWTDEGSGHSYSDVLLPLFREFNGNISALVIWEGGDSVQRLTIQDGVVEEAEIE